MCSKCEETHSQTGCSSIFNVQALFSHSANPHGDHNWCSSLWEKGHPRRLQGNSVSVNSVISRVYLALPSICKLVLRKSTVVMPFPSSRRASDRRGPSSPMWVLPQSVQQSQLFFIRLEKKTAAFVWSGRSNMGESEDIDSRLGRGAQAEPSSLCSLTPQGHLLCSRFWGASDVHILARHPHYCCHLLHFKQCLEDDTC